MKTWLWPIPVIWQPFWKLEHTMTRYDIKVVAGVSIFSCKPVWPISYILYQPMSAKRSHSHSFSFSSQGRPVHVVFRSARSGIHEYAHLQHISNLGKWCSHANVKIWILNSRRKFRSQTSDNIWTDEKQSRAEAERKERLAERRVEEKESEERRCRCAKR